MLYNGFTNSNEELQVTILAAVTDVNVKTWFHALTFINLFNIDY